MNARDFNGRFEQTLKANKIEYTVTLKTEILSSIRWDIQEFRLKAAYRNPEVLVVLIKTTRPVRFMHLGRTSHKCYVVASYGRKNPVAVKGLRGVWQEIRLACFPIQEKTI